MALPVLTPYYNLWGKDVYQQETGFEHFPERIPALSTSGSAVVLGRAGFAGIQGRGDVRIHHDGKNTLTIDAPAGVTVFISENARGYEAWRNFNEETGIIKKGNSFPQFFYQPEYNTWVEQVRRDKNTQQGNVLDDKLIDDFMMLMLMKKWIGAG
ncbi:MAG: hypothetical protein A2096_12675 [Spirochaetes bacterium GWF1_41_5]|nr:MAG: hypothetical protein A2096_12675 [Spirochaetes bacterium GWF1_41_5]HBE01783.1 hypothetical protein [Spirochaetia bacterium]